MVSNSHEREQQRQQSTNPSSSRRVVDQHQNQMVPSIRRQQQQQVSYSADGDLQIREAIQHQQHVGNGGGDDAVAHRRDSFVSEASFDVDAFLVEQHNHSMNARRESFRDESSATNHDTRTLSAIREQQQQQRRQLKPFFQNHAVSSLSESQGWKYDDAITALVSSSESANNDEDNDGDDFASGFVSCRDPLGVTTPSDLRQRKGGLGNNDHENDLVRGYNVGTIMGEEGQKDGGNELSVGTSFNLAAFEPKRLTASLTEDIYSLMFVSPWYSEAFIFSLFVFAFQSTFIGLILYDQIDLDRPDNIFQIPPGVTFVVTMAQLLSTILVVPSQDDVLTALTQMIDGYHPKILQKNPHATRAKFILASIAQLLVGLGTLFTTCVLINQSEDVLSLMLSFAGLEFISNIDNLAFLIAKNGFFTVRLRRECIRVADLLVPTRGYHTTFRCIVYVLITAALIYIWGDTLRMQRTGAFLCRSVFLQYGDVYYGAMPFYGGSYKMTDFRIDNRVTYIDAGESMVLCYCAKKKVWVLAFVWQVFPIDDDNFDTWDWDGDHCESQIARSQPTLTFDPIVTSEMTWYIENFYSKEFVPFDWFYMFCDDCAKSISPGCGRHGECVDGTCVCDPFSFGVTCTHDLPCPQLHLDARRPDMPPVLAGTEGGAITKVQIEPNFDMLLDPEDATPIKANYFPVYFANTLVFNSLNTSDVETSVAIMMYQGRRWHLQTVPTNVKLERLIQIFKNEWDATCVMMNDDMNDHYRSGALPCHQEQEHFFNAFPAVISDAVDLGTVSEKVAPMGIEFYESDTTYAASSEALGPSLLCPICDDKLAFCQAGGDCVNSLCECRPGFRGSLCEKRCDLEDTSEVCVDFFQKNNFTRRG